VAKHILIDRRVTLSSLLYKKLL